MDDKMRARNYYAKAVSLFQDPSADDCKQAIELLNKAVDLYPKFSEVALFREKVWHYLLKFLDPDNNCRTYRKEYLDSPAWEMKRNAIMKRDGYQCVCGAKATEVHHKTYDNIGKELLSDLVFLCKVCHERAHRSRVPFDQQAAIQKEARGAFIAYVARESAILRLDDFGNDDYIGYESGYEKENGYRQIWLAAWLPVRPNDIAAVIAIQSNSGYCESHYKKFEEHKDRIKETFSFEEVKFREAGSNIRQLYVVRQNIDLTQTADKEAAFRWLRENLEKLHWVLRVHDTFGWDIVSSNQLTTESERSEHPDN